LSLETLEFNKDLEIESKRISALKIKIPSNLQPIVDKLLQDVNSID